MDSKSAANLRARNFSVERNGEALVKVDDLVLSPGEVAWISAPSGAGKSTFLLALAHLIPSYGELSLGDLSSVDTSPHQWRRNVTFSPFPPTALGEDLKADLLSPYKLKIHDHDKVPSDKELEEGLSRVGLGDYPLERETRRLSQGELSRLALLRVILTKPRVLLLDETGANVDSKSSALMDELIGNFAKGGGIVVATGHTMPWRSVTRRFSISEGILEEER